MHVCLASAPSEQADRIREARKLLSRHVVDARKSVDCMPRSQAIEAMLAVGAHESAVLSLIGGKTGFMLSRGRNGNCLASTVLAEVFDEDVAEGSDEVVAEASTPALALLAAYLASLLTDCEKTIAEKIGITAKEAARPN